MDSEQLTITYPSVADAVAEMRNLGLGNHLRGRPNALITPRTWQRVIESYPRVNDTIPVTLELVYAHAWRGPSKNTATVKLELP